MTLDLRLVANGGLTTETGDDNSDSTGIFTATAGTITATAVPRNATVYRVIDYGAAYTAQYFVKGTYNITGGSHTGGVMTAGFSDTLGDPHNATSFSGIYLQDNSGPAGTIYAVKVEAGVGAVGAGISVTEGAPNYCKHGVSTALNQYGTSFVQVFSDSGFSNLVGTSVVALTVAPSYRYYYPAATNNNGTAVTIDATLGSQTITLPAAGVDMTAGVETDTGTGRLVVYADCIVATALNIANSETAKHVAIDEGAGFFGDYTISGVLKITAFASGSVTQMFEILAVTDAAADAGAANDLQGIDIYYQTATTYFAYIHQSIAGVDTTSSASPVLNTNQPYTFTLSRSGSTLTMKVWNDLVLTNFAGTSQVGSTVTWTGRATTTYRYLMPVASYLNGATSRSSTFTIGGVQRQGTPVTSITATKGAFSWVGKTTTLSAQPTSINATKGAFSWAGNSSPLSLMVQATKGAFNWAGKIVNLNTGGQVNTTPGMFNWTGKFSPFSNFIPASKGAFSWAGKTSILGSAVTSLRTATLTKWDTATQKEIPDTGLTGVLYMLYDPTNLKVYDFSDNTFKASASCVTPRGTMTERVLLNSVGTNLTPGIYDILLATTGLSGLYQEYLFYYGTTNHLDSNPVRFQDGIEYLGGLTVAENTTLNTVPASVLAAATTTPIAANIEAVNAQTITGNGTTIPWGPV